MSEDFNEYSLFPEAMDYLLTEARKATCCECMRDPSNSPVPKSIEDVGSLSSRDEERARAPLPKREEAASIAYVDVLGDVCSSIVMQSRQLMLWPAK